MQLHPLIADHELPAALRRPLRFGDPEQIRALREVDETLAEREQVAEAAGVAVEQLRRYRVEVSVEAEFYIDVLAANPSHAIELAKDEAGDLTAHDFDLEFHYAPRLVGGGAERGSRC